MKLKEKKPALILIDIQKGFLNEASWGGNRNNKNAEIICGEILDRWRMLGLPIFHIRHSSTNKDSKLHISNKGFEFNDKVKPNPGEPIITKNVNSAFIDTDLKKQLDILGIKEVVIIGLTTDHCVSTTTRMASNYGFNTYLVEDAVATFNKVGSNGQKYNAQLIHDTAIASLKDEFSTIIKTNDIQII